MKEFVKVGELTNSRMRKLFPTFTRLFPKGTRTDVYVVAEVEPRTSWPIPGT